MKHTKLTLGSLVLRGSQGAVPDAAGLRRSLEVNLTRGLSGHEHSWAGGSVDSLQLRAKSPNGPSQIGATISDTLLRALRKSR
jgi:hypothetical protein